MRSTFARALGRHLTAGSLAMSMLMGLGCDSDDPSGPGSDNTAPTVTTTNPLPGATGVAVITASFSEAMLISSIKASTFYLTGPGTVVIPGSVTYNFETRIAQFVPNNSLAPDTGYTATVTTGVQDLAGNALAADHSWNFTTAVSPSGQTSPVLGDAGDFVILAGSTITSTGATALTGDLGVSPGTALTGFPPGTLTGTQHLGNSTSASAMADLTTSYNDAAGRSVAPVVIAGNLGGLTLPPGLYKSTSSLEISSGDLTLDAKGNSDAVFIFQIASTLTTSSARKVILAGGAKATNIYWQVGSSATLGTTSSFRGTIMANQSITLNTGASLNGRALARIGAVTLAGNAVVIPTP
jgi:hypothetical protein